MMEKINGVPMIGQTIARCAATYIPTSVIIPKDDPLKDWLIENHIQYFEGSEKDVLSRYYHCVKTMKLKYFIRVTGDCPLISPENIAYVNFMGNSSNAEYASNCIYECVDGQEVEYVSDNLIELAHQKAVSEEDREHVTTWIKKNLDSKQFPWIGLRDHYPIDCIPKMSVDTPEDLERVRDMFNKLVNRKKLWS
jgi:spore coat polysaccharide biosynthesis protein SpsF (cytidylyltransferase family)